MSTHRQPSRLLHGCASTHSLLNNMDAQSHEFMLLAFCRMHNQLVDSGWAPSVLKANRRKKSTPGPMDAEEHVGTRLLV